MRAILDNFRRILYVVGVTELAFSIVILVAILANIGAQVFSRYVLNLPLIWVEELASYLLIWLGFLSAAVAHKQRRHVSIALLHAIKSPPLARALTILAEICVIFLALVLLANIPLAIGIESRTTSIGLPIDIPKHWFFSVPLAIGAASLLFTSLHGLLSALTTRPDKITPILGRFGDHSDPDLERVEAALEGRTST
jgi:TRAP-type C4-dicarboxylate transport system permease small subunit